MPATAMRFARGTSVAIEVEVHGTPSVCHTPTCGALLCGSASEWGFCCDPALCGRIPPSPICTYRAACHEGAIVHAVCTFESYPSLTPAVVASFVPVAHSATTGRTKAISERAESATFFTARLLSNANRIIRKGEKIRPTERKVSELTERTRGVVSQSEIRIAETAEFDAGTQGLGETGM